MLSKIGDQGLHWKKLQFFFKVMLFKSQIADKEFWTHFKASTYFQLLIHT